MNKKKYDFDLLAIGESEVFFGDLQKIRVAASMWGRRYGFWLKAEQHPQGALVTRLASPPSKKSKVREQLRQNDFAVLNERLKRLEDGVRFLCIAVTKMKQL